MKMLHTIFLCVFLFPFHGIVAEEDTASQQSQKPFDVSFTEVISKLSEKIKNTTGWQISSSFSDLGFLYAALLVYGRAVEEDCPYSARIISAGIFCMICRVALLTAFGNYPYLLRFTGTSPQKQCYCPTAVEADGEAV